MKEVIVKPGGCFIFNANTIKEIRSWFRWEIRHGVISIRKELG